MLRTELATAPTSMDLACSCSITPFRLADSATAPCTGYGLPPRAPRARESQATDNAEDLDVGDTATVTSSFDLQVGGGRGRPSCSCFMPDEGEALG